MARKESRSLLISRSSSSSSRRQRRSHEALIQRHGYTPSSIYDTDTMCKVARYQSPDCGHSWLVLATPCAAGRNLTTCQDFKAGALTWVDSLAPFRRVRMAPPESCHWCDKRGDYSSTTHRMIKRESSGIRFGLGPGRHQLGVDIPCLVM